MKERFLFFALCMVAAWPAPAEIYKFVDENGRVTYTNIPRKGAIKLDIGGAEAPARNRNHAGPGNFPKVDAKTQRQRDDLRRQILEDELASEQRALAEARRALQEGEAAHLPEEAGNPQKTQERLKRLREAVALHERNIAALRRELGLAR
ncbi:DUF4124 domain-containing protein [Thiobacter aerophilum]|uniref:DUF4124 domain-containing protein n=1 Tax=Thiobacter aerophilum TaxID=3121275 RepID=A0ABV0EGQ1_9BURK